MVAAWSLQVTPEEEVVAEVGFVKDVEGVAEEGNGADDEGDSDVGKHSEEEGPTCAADPGCDGDDEREDAGDDVAEAGDESNDAVNAEAVPEEGNVEGFIEQNLNAVQAFVAKDPGEACEPVWGSGRVED